MSAEVTPSVAALVAATVTKAFSLPHNLGDLDLTLTNLDLSCCGLASKIPESLDRLSNVTTLNLSENKLNGEIPSSLMHLSHLTILNLRMNKLSCKIKEEL